MKLSTAASAGALALVWWTFPALAQAPSQAAPPATPPHSGEFPGTLDPSTKIFTPLGSGAATPAPPVQGTVDVTLVFDLDPDFSEFDTIFCNVTLEFGGVPNKGFIPNYFVFASLDFFAGNPPPPVQLPYHYTPDTEIFIEKLEIACEGRGDSGEEHTFSDTEFFTEVTLEFRIIVPL